MLSPYDLLMGMALLQEKNKCQSSSIYGWTGVLVRVGEKKILIERENLKEIISLSKATKLIDHRAWLIGLTGYEGKIIPLVEFRCLMQDGHESLGLKDRQVLVISRQNGVFGLLVDKVIGHRNYWSDDEALFNYREHSTGLTKVGFSHEDGQIEVCDMENLATTLGLRRQAAVI